MTAPAKTTFSNVADTWNQRYASADYLFGTRPNAWLEEHGNVWAKGQRVLCVADGEGRNSVWLGRKGLEVDAFDIASVGVAKARKLAESHGVAVNYSISDCDSFGWCNDTYDGVVAIFVQFADPAMRARLFANIRRCLKPGGVLVLQGYTPPQLDFGTGGPKELSHLYTNALLREAFADFDIVHLRDYEAELNEGDRHSGMSALVGLVAWRRAA